MEKDLPAQAGNKKSAIKGIISLTSKATGYVTVPEFTEDIVVEREFVNTALNYDEVEVSLFPQVKGERLSGEVVKVLRREKTEFVGTIDKRKGSAVCFVIPDDTKMYSDIFISFDESKILQNNLKVLVDIKKWDDPK